MGAQVNKCEEKIKKLEERVKDLERERERRTGRTEEEGSEEGTMKEGARSRYSERSRGNSCASISALSGVSGLSEGEVERIRKWVTEKDREERSNIVIKGIRFPKELEKDEKGGREWAAGWIKEKVGVNCKVINCRESGGVIIVKLEDVESKKEIMRNKFKLKGEKIFIENYLSCEKRKIKERINRWVKNRGKRV